MQLDQVTYDQLAELEQSLTADYNAVKPQGLSLDLTRGKPSEEQVALSDALDGILQGNYLTEESIDCRNYGGIDGIAAMKHFGAQLLEVDPANVLVGGNSSLTLMHQAVLYAHLLGVDNNKANAWREEEGQIKFLCPVPGYDRHFSICEQLDIEMINVAMTATGPDMDQVEALVKADPLIKGIWCVPKYANPTGIVYSDDTVERIAALGSIAGKNFRVMWDNAYAVHDLTTTPQTLASITKYSQTYGTEDNIIQFASTSKITYAGSGIAFLSASANNLTAFKTQLGISTIGPDKVNQQRHALFFKEAGALTAHMRKHQALTRPKFDIVLNALEAAFGNCDDIRWTRPAGGYFISVDLLPGLAQQVVSLAGAVGVKLTPAGATFPYGNDPNDSNIRLAPTYPPIAEIERAIHVFILCVKLALVQKKLGESPP